MSLSAKLIFYHAESADCSNRNDMRRIRSLAMNKNNHGIFGLVIFIPCALIQRKAERKLVYKKYLVKLFDFSEN